MHSKGHIQTQTTATDTRKSSEFFTTTVILAIMNEIVVINSQSTGTKRVSIIIKHSLYEQQDTASSRMTNGSISQEIRDTT